LFHVKHCMQKTVENLFHVKHFGRIEREKTRKMFHVKHCMQKTVENLFHVKQFKTKKALNDKK